MTGNDYFKTTFKFSTFTETEGDILAALLCEIGYETFEQENDFLISYIKADNFSNENTSNALLEYPFDSEI